MMNASDLIMVMILGGFALCGAYFRAQYMDWRNQQTVEVGRTIRLRLLYRDQLSRSQESIVAPVIDLAGVRANTRIPEAVEMTGRRQTLPLRNAA
jgi:hypothetical protein